MGSFTNPADMRCLHSLPLRTSARRLLKASKPHQVHHFPRETAILSTRVPCCDAIPNKLSLLKCYELLNMSSRPTPIRKSFASVRYCKLLKAWEKESDPKAEDAALATLDPEALARDRQHLKSVPGQGLGSIRIAHCVSGA